jgi:hypothetical protein
VRDQKDQPKPGSGRRLKAMVSARLVKVRSAIKRHSARILATVSVLGTLTGVVGIYLALNQDAPEAPVSAEQQELLAKVPPKVGYRCHPVDEGEALRQFERLALATVGCQPVDPGPRALSFVSFGTEADMNRYMQKIYGQVERSGAGCSDGYLDLGRWMGGDGRSHGELICASDEDDTLLIWSDRRSLTIGATSAVGGAQQKLHNWWQRSVKYEGDGAPPAKREELIDYLPGAFGQCEPSKSVLPSSIVGVSCQPGHGISSSGASLFRDRSQVERYLNSFAADYSGATEKGCGETTLSFTTWGTGEDAKPAEGKLLCYVSGGRQWFVWSTFEPPVYAYASREDEDLSRLYRQWSDELSYIGKGR